MKQIKFLVLPIVLLLCCVVLIACSNKNENGNKNGNENNNGNNTNTKIDLADRMFYGYEANLGEFEQISIIKQGQKNVLVGFDGDNQRAEIIFRKIDDSTQTLTQSNIDAQIDKLYVTTDYIFFTFTDKTNILRSGDDYDQINYYCYDSNRSFVIDRSNFKIHSLNQFSRITRIEKDLLYTDSGYYLLTIESDQVKFTNIIPNKDIGAGSVLVDKDGYIFVGNNVENRVVGRIIYYVLSSSGFAAIGSDGYLYTVTNSTAGLFSNGTQLSRYDTSTFNWSGTFTVSDTISLQVNIYTWVITSNRVMQISTSYLRGGSFTSYANAKAISSVSEVYDTRVGVSAHNMLSVSSDKLYRYNGTTKQEIASGYTSYTRTSKSITGLKVTFETTERYDIKIVNGLAIETLIVEIVGDPNVIVIKPLL